VGDRVAAIGNGYGQGLGIGVGPVTGVNVTTAPSGDGSAEPMTGMIEARTDLRPGASGGAMVNMSGQVIGVNTATGVIPGTRTRTDTDTPSPSAKPWQWSASYWQPTSSARSP